MKTDVITVSSRGKRMESALGLVDKVAAYKELPPKSALHLRLLAEEMMQMMRSITGETEGQFWIEDEHGEYQLHLQVATRLSTEKREQLLSVSASGKNESAHGIMGRLREFFDSDLFDGLEQESKKSWRAQRRQRLSVAAHHFLGAGVQRKTQLVFQL